MLSVFMCGVKEMADLVLAVLLFILKSPSSNLASRLLVICLLGSSVLLFMVLRAEHCQVSECLSFSERLSPSSDVYDVCHIADMDLQQAGWYQFELFLKMPTMPLCSVEAASLYIFGHGPKYKGP